MARATHRLDLLLVPGLDVPIERAHEVLSALVQSGVCEPGGDAGPEGTAWVPGGFARIYVERPQGLTLFANRTGGFRVQCPDTAAPIVASFQQAMGRWRAGGPRTLSCPACDAIHDLDQLGFQPPAAFGTWALVTADAGSPELCAEARAQVEALIGPTRRVWRH